MKHYKRVKKNRIADVYAYIYAVLFVYGKCVWNALDWMGKKLVDLIDHSDFFAGCLWTYAIMTMWEMLTR